MATVQEILNQKGDAIHSIDVNAWVLDAACKMNELSIGGLIVVEDEVAVGMFTERDILRRVVAAQLDPSSTRVADVMTTPIAVCRPDTSIAECRSVMTERRIRHLPIVEGEQVRGIVTIGDMLAHELGEYETTIQYLNSYVFEQR